MWTREYPAKRIFKREFIEKHIEGLVKAANMDSQTMIGIYIATPRQIALRNYPLKHSTDSLSFPYHNPLQSSEFETKCSDLNGEDDAWCLGEIVLCPERICTGRRHPLVVRRRLETLLTHGFVHLLGYDHHVKEEWLEMRRIEKILTNKLHKPSL